VSATAGDGATMTVVMVPNIAIKRPCLSVRFTPGRLVLIASIKINIPNEALL